MEPIRTIVNAGVLSPIINLPWKKDMQVEVFVTPIEEEPIRQKLPFESLKGCLKEYANPDLWEKERYAWRNNVIEKYGTI